MAGLAPKKRAFVDAFDERLRRVDGAVHDASAHPSERASHRLRTSTRRLEATLSLLPRRLRAHGALADFLARAKVLFEAHGRARDLDVLAKRLAAYPECAALVRRIRRERDRARAEAIARTAETIAAPAPLAVEDVHRGALRKRVEKRLTRLHRRLARDMGSALAHARDDEHAHDARKTAKQLRYVLEALDEERHAAALAALTGLQDHLGTMHDAAVAGERLRSERDPSLARAIEGEERARLALHASLQERWRAVREALADLER